MQDIDTLGVFWLSGREEDQLSGRLQFHPKDGITLSLVGRLEGRENVIEPTIRILGVTDRNYITLDQGFSKGTSSSSPGIFESRYYFNRMFVGHHFGEEEDALQFQSVTLELSHLDS